MIFNLKNIKPIKDHTGYGRVILIIFPYLIFSFLFQIIGLGISGGLSAPLNKATTLQLFASSFFEFLGTLFVIHLFNKYLFEDSLKNLGFNTRKRLSDFIVGILLGFLVMLIGYNILIYLGEITYLKTTVNFKEIIFSVLLFTAVSISEEVFLRGYVLRSLMISFNKYIALLISSVVFCALHLGNPNLSAVGIFELFLAGILLGISYIYTKNLWFPIGLHLSWNLFQSFFGFNVSGLNLYSIIEFSVTENNLLNGGNFGFEGSILSVLSSAIIIIGVWVYYHKKKARL